MKTPALLFLTAAAAAQGALQIHTGAPEGKPAALSSKDASLQLLVTGSGDGGRETDLTRAVTWQVEPAGAIAISPAGIATPQQNGTVTLTARTPGGDTASAVITVSGAAAARPLHFANDIVPVMTKYGCNGGGCHGKSEGQNGFKLSLLGFEPADDYAYLVHESRGRRLFPAAPESSLLLLKGTGEMPHGGGARMKRDTPDYQTVVRWMEQGMPRGDAAAPAPVGLSVFPPGRILPPDADQQLQVTAHYADGSWRNVTALVTYESGAKEMASVTESGLVHTARQPGDVAVMVRFMELVGVFRATIPLGAPAGEFPPERNLVDQHVFAKLKMLGLPRRASATMPHSCAGFPSTSPAACPNPQKPPPSPPIPPRKNGPPPWTGSSPPRIMRITSPRNGRHSSAINGLTARPTAPMPSTAGSATSSTGTARSVNSPRRSSAPRAA